MQTIISPNRVAVITGAAKGIGAAAARRFAQSEMRLVLFDQDEAALQNTAGRLKQLGAEIRCVAGNVTSAADWQRLHDAAYGEFGETALLMNNAGIIQGASPWQDMVAWRRQLDVNLLSIVQAQITFVPSMLAQTQASAVVNLGSKEGITTPPGNAAYSVAKAGVKVLTEQLAHELRHQPNSKVSAHLFVPGYTWTPMNFPNMNENKPAEKPAAPWTAAQLLDYFVQRFEQGDFYILCPDNEVSPELDKLRIQWAADDLIHNRPALSRWHNDWQAKFNDYIQQGMKRGLSHD